VRDKEKRVVLEKNGGKKPEKHHEEEEAPENASDGQSEKQKAQASLKKGDPVTPTVDPKAAPSKAATEAAKTAPKEDAQFVPPELAGLVGAAIGVKSSFFPAENSFGMPMHLNDDVYGDNLFGSKAKFDPFAFKTSAERENIDKDGLSYDSAQYDVDGRSLTAPPPTEEQSNFENQQWSPSL
jgi:hypothetical protein